MASKRKRSFQKKRAPRPRRKKPRKPFRVPAPFKLRPKTKRQIKKSLPIAKLIFVFAVGYLVYAVGKTDVPTPSISKPKATVSEKKTASIKKAKKPESKPVSKVIKKAPKPAPRKVEPPKKTTTTTPVVIPAKKIRTTAWSQRPKLVFVIDDIGNNVSNEKLYLKLEDHITYAILPLLRYSEYFSRLSLKTNAEVILHLPLESKKGEIPGPGLITNRMPPDFVLERLDRDLKSVPHHVGANNHMGSYGSADPNLMRVILKEFKRRDLFFLDSYTSSSSVIIEIANDLRLPVLKRDVFLDNVDEPSQIRSQIRRLEYVARQQGYAIAIGHDRYNTLSIILDEIPKLRAKGFEIISLAELLDYKNKR